MQRVEDPSRRVRPMVVRRDVVRETAAARPSSSVTDECRRLAELLRLEAVGVATQISDGVRMSWWSAPGTPPLPARLDEVLAGDVAGWIVCPLPGDAAVFAHAGPEASPRAATVLRAVGPSLVAGTSAGDSAGDDGPERTISSDARTSPTPIHVPAQSSTPTIS